MNVSLRILLAHLFRVNAILLLLVFCSPLLAEETGTASRSKQKYEGIPAQALKSIDPRIDPLPFDELPESLEDLQKLEEITLKLTSDYQAATVNIQVGGGQGSGVVVSPRGHILTAAHVVGEAGNSVIVVFNDGRRHRATVLGVNPSIDSAIVRLDGRGPYEFVPMATNEFTQTGRWVIAIGHPNGYESSRLPVVRLGRVITTTSKTVQTDCSLVGGDSGGPLFDLSGRVVGVHSRIGVSNSFNFHVPVEVYLRDWADLTSGEAELDDEDAPQPEPARKAYLGIRGRDAANAGLMISEVTPDGPAATAGLERGDIIVKCDDERVRNFAALVKFLKTKTPDDKITITVERNGREKAFKVTLGATEL
ncbi:S1C family serine protease [Rubinisphaera margarita]|uniref:S1C family serine protease n=1 Tax=Rubinisphaera margarita TaxID=2909586 RepID=UPI001EE9306C|nr:trypsin-like peptidase domain-containing protein [Rubinisphaera margarita]MCG6155635.1 S1C family serine protease [Rubinisphaera margarita]